MSDQSKTNHDLIQELISLRKRIAELSQYESDRKQAESQREAALEALRESEYKYRSLIDNIPEIIFTIDLEGKITFVSKRAKEILGYENEEAINRNIFDFIPEEAHESTMEKLLRGMKGEKIEHVQLPVTAKSGKKLYFDFSFSRIYKEGAVVGAQGTGVDITERKRAEEVIRQSEEKYRTILETFQEGYFEVDLKGNFTFCNDSMFRITGYSKEELLGINYRVYTDEENAKKVYQTFNKVYTTGEPSKGIDWPFIKKDATKKYIESSIILQKDSSGKPTGFKGMFRDITERKQVERKLRDSEEKFRLLAESTSFAIGLHRGDNWIYANRAAEEISGYTQEELHKMHFWDFVHPDYQNMVKESAYNRQQGQVIPRAYEFKIITKNGVGKWVSLTGSPIIYEDKPTALISVEDITERKTAAESIRNSELKYRNIFENAIEGIYQSTIAGRFITANAAFARMAGYDSPEELIESIKDIGTQLYVHSEDRKRFMEIRDAKGFVDGFEVEFYKKNGSTFWVVINARTVKDEQGKILYFEGLIEDISLRKHAEKQLHQTLESLRKAVGTTIQVLVSAVESRDAYTAGHQSRSADLACAIAREMGLAPYKIEGIRMAGIIHDIGKLSIPVEILSKPSKLTNIEFSLIKEHSRRGYEMLKDVESPWPLAEIVYQHHERMNGSGYPRNLKGDEIIIESQILAVADVMEAMASHRPYRPALGIEAALEEIEKNKGILYDNVVADACLKLFREKRYQLGNPG
jgi:PAS domain S-box-containing protein